MTTLLKFQKARPSDTTLHLDVITLSQYSQQSTRPQYRIDGKLVRGSYGSVGERKNGKVPNSFRLMERDSGKWRVSNYVKDEVHFEKVSDGRSQCSWTFMRVQCPNYRATFQTDEDISGLFSSIRKNTQRALLVLINVGGRGVSSVDLEQLINTIRGDQTLSISHS
jgi:hypothetical protein